MPLPTNIVVRNAIAADLESLVRINRKWQKPALAGAIANGYLGGTIPEEAFLQMMATEQLVIATNGADLAGYYLLNTISTDGVFSQHAGIVRELQSRGVLASSAVGVGAQALVDSPYQGSGVRPLMLQRLVGNLTGRYRQLFSTIGKDNPRALGAHSRDGWRIVGEEVALYYVVYDLPLSM